MRGRGMRGIGSNSPISKRGQTQTLTVGNTGPGQMQNPADDCVHTDLDDEGHLYTVGLSLDRTHVLAAELNGEGMSRTVRALDRRA